MKLTQKGFIHFLPKDSLRNVLGVVFTTPPKITNGSSALFTKYDQKPDQLPIRYFTQLRSANLQSIAFHDIHGPELELFCQNKVAFRKSMLRNSSLEIIKYVFY